MMNAPLGPHLHAFFIDYLSTQKGVRLTTVRSYRDALRLLLTFVANDMRRPITRLTLGDLTFERVLQFLKHLEVARGNSVATRNQRLAAIHMFFGYIASRVPEMLDVAQRIAAIPTKRAPQPETHYLERDEVAKVFSQLPKRGRHALRDRVLLLTSALARIDPGLLARNGPPLSSRR